MPDEYVTRREFDLRFEALEKFIAAQLAAQKEAVTKAETATNDRLAGLNELRGAMQDQALGFMPRAEAEIRIAALERHVTVSAGERQGGGTVVAWIGFAFGMLVGLIGLAARFMGK